LGHEVTDGGGINKKTKEKGCRIRARWGNLRARGGAEGEECRQNKIKKGKDDIRGT